MPSNEKVEIRSSSHCNIREFGTRDPARSSDIPFQRTRITLANPAANSCREYGELDGLYGTSGGADERSGKNLLLSELDSVIIPNLSSMKSDKIVFAAVGTEKENLSPLTDFNINFVDRQTLKILEDSVIDLQVILPTLLETVIGIRDQCRKFIVRCKLTKEETDLIELVSDEFDEYVRVAQCHVERAKILRQRATAIAQLVSWNS